MAVSAVGVLAGSAVASSPAVAAPTTVAVSAATGTASTIQRYSTVAHLAVSKKVITAGDTITVTGWVGYGTRRVIGKTVRLQQYRGNGWVTIAVKRLVGNGRAVFPVTPTATSRYRLFYPGMVAVAPAAFTRSVSAVVTVTVNQRSRAARVIALAKRQVGKAYVYGAAGPSTFDCSGLTQYVFRKVGVSLPHRANGQRGYGRAVSRSQAKAGDLVFFLSGGYAYHVGVYAGGGYMYDAPTPGQRVGRHKIWSSDISFRRLV